MAQWGTLIGGALGAGIGSVVAPGVGTAIGGSLGAGLGSLFDPIGRPTLPQDLIADIRRRLEGLAEEVPPMVERRKELLREQFGVAEEAGLEDIAGEFRAERGFGELSTPEVRRRAMLRETLARGLAGEELRAEEWGLGQRMGLTERLGGLQIPEEEPGFGEQLLGFGGELLGEEVRARKLRDIFKETEEIPDITRTLEETPTVIKTGDERSPYLPYEEFEERFRRRR